jgi:hypothetical protein
MSTLLSTETPASEHQSPAPTIPEPYIPLLDDIGVPDDRRLEYLQSLTAMVDAVYDLVRPNLN